MSDQPQDFDAMSEEELETFLNQAEDKEETQSEEETTSDTQDEEGETESKDKPVEPDTDEDEIDSPFYKGKSRKELVELIEANNKHTARQGNELYKLRKDLEKIQSSTITTATEKKEETDDILSQYDEASIKAIKTIIRREFEEKEAKATQITKAEAEKNTTENELIWEGVKAFNSDFKPLEEKLINEIRLRGESSTLQKAGWVKEFIKSNSNPQTTKAPNGDKIIKKKMKASTVSGGAATQSSTGWKGKPEPNDSNDYLAWLKDNKGISI